MEEQDEVDGNKNSKNIQPLATEMNLNRSDVPPTKYTGGQLCKEVSSHTQVHIPAHFLAV